ncbi:hypothetical protein NHX12_006505, partial [Muraenolepis orangiensis]
PGQGGFKKICRTEEDGPSPFPGLASGVLEMRVKEGSKIRNLMGFAMARMQGEKVERGGGGVMGVGATGGLRQVVFTGSGRAVTKTITCAEIMKRKVGSLHQLTKLRYKGVKEVWESRDGGASEMTVHRTVPSISILLSKDPLDTREPGYQPPETLGALWEEREREDTQLQTAFKRPLGPVPLDGYPACKRVCLATVARQSEHSLRRNPGSRFYIQRMASTTCIVLALVSSLCGVLLGHSEGDRALDLMSRYPLIDGHNDLAIQLRLLSNNRLSQLDLYNLSSATADITRLQAGHVQTQVFAAYVLCGAQEKDAVRLTLEQIDVIRRMCTEYKELELVTSAEGLREAAGRRTVACLLSVEGGHSIDSSLPALRMFYQLGVRSMALTHNCNTPWAASSSTLYHFHQRENNSLTIFGQAVVREMNRLGMIVDLSHSSWETAKAAISISKAPVIFSHSSAYAVCNHTRNVPDWLLRELRKNGGVIMVNLYSGFVACRGQATVSRVADHFDHIRETIGAQSIGIGGDYGGVLGFPLGLEDVSKYPVLIQELLRRKWPEQEVAGVLRNNFLRVFDEVERVREELSGSQPSEEQMSLSEELNHPCRLVLGSSLPDGAWSSLRTPRFLWAALLLLPGLLALY